MARRRQVGGRGRRTARFGAFALILGCTVQTGVDEPEPASEPEPYTPPTEPLPMPEPEPEPEAFEPVSDEELRELLTTLDPETEISGSHACPRGSNCLVFNGLEFELYDPTTQSATGMAFVHDQLLSAKLPERERHERQVRAMRMLLEPVKGRPVSVHCKAAGVMPEVVGWTEKDGFVTVDVPSGRAPKSKSKPKALTPAEANAETERIAKKLRFDEAHDQMAETYEEFWERLRPFSDEELATMTGEGLATPTLRVVEDDWSSLETEYFLRVLVLYSPESGQTYLGNASVVGDLDRMERRRDRHRALVREMLDEAGAQTLRFRSKDACWLPNSMGGDWLEAAR